MIKDLFDNKDLKASDIPQLSIFDMSDVDRLYNLSGYAFSHIFLLFDIDSNEQTLLDFMFKHFNESTERGLFLPSSPMIESFIDITRSLYVGSTKDYKQEIHRKHSPKWHIEVSNSFNEYLLANFRKFTKDDMSHVLESKDFLSKGYTMNSNYPVFSLLHMLLIELTMVETDEVDDTTLISKCIQKLYQNSNSK